MGKEENQSEDSGAFNRRVKYSLIVFAVIEFIVMALVFYYKAKR